MSNLELLKFKLQYSALSHKWQTIHNSLNMTFSLSAISTNEKFVQLLKLQHLALRSVICFPWFGVALVLWSNYYLICNVRLSVFVKREKQKTLSMIQFKIVVLSMSSTFLIVFVTVEMCRIFKIKVLSMAYLSSHLTYCFCRSGNELNSL